MDDAEFDSKITYSDVLQLAENKDVAGLINVLMYSKKRVSVIYAAGGLGHMGVKSAIIPLLDVALNFEHGIAGRKAAIRALGKIGGDEVLQPLIYIMEKNSLTRRETAETLGDLKNDLAVEPLAMVLNNESEEQDAREAAAEALGKIANKTAIMELIKALDIKLCLVEEKASSVLKEIGEPAVEPLISALKDDSQSIRKNAIFILGEIGDKKATDALLSILVKLQLSNMDAFAFDNIDTFYQVACALGKIKDHKAVGPLIRIVKEFGDVHGLQACAITALGEIGDKQATETLVRLLVNKNIEAHVRIAAASSLGKIADETAVESLVGILEDNRDDMQQYAFEALLKYDAAVAAIPIVKYLKTHPNLLTQNYLLVQLEK